MAAGQAVIRGWWWVWSAGTWWLWWVVDGGWSVAGGWVGLGGVVME